MAEGILNEGALTSSELSQPEPEEIHRGASRAKTTDKGFASAFTRRGSIAANSGYG